MALWYKCPLWPLTRWWGLHGWLPWAVRPGHIRVPDARRGTSQPRLVKTLSAGLFRADFRADVEPPGYWAVLCRFIHLWGVGLWCEPSFAPGPLEVSAYELLSRGRINVRKGRVDGVSRSLPHKLDFIDNPYNLWRWVAPRGYFKKLFNSA